MIRTIAAHELRTLFVTPLGWCVLVTFQIINAWMFLVLVEEYLGLQGQIAGTESTVGVTDLVIAPMFRLSSWFLLLIVPLLSMRSFAGERRNRTLPLLLSAPVSVGQLVVGKYLGLLGFLAILLTPLLSMPLSLYLGASLDTGKLLAGLLGLVLMAASFAALGLYVSSLATQPAVAAFGTLGALLLCWLVDAAVTTEQNNMLASLSLLRHFEQLASGVFQSSNLVFPIIFILTFLGLSIHQLDHERRGSQR